MLTGTAEMSTSTLTATLILIEISTATKPSNNYRKGDSLIKGVRANGSTIRNTGRAFRIATKGRRRNLIGRARRTRFNPESSFVDELNRMGADIRTEGHHAVVRGRHRLSGAPVRALDLRAGAALILAALGAEGLTEVADAHHVDRGYEDIDARLSALGAEISRQPSLSPAFAP